MDDLPHWLQDARAGSPEAFDRLVDPFGSAAYHVAYQVTSDPDEAVDACREAVSKAWLGLPRFEGDADGFGRWLLSLVVTAARDHIRAERQPPPVSGDIEAAARPAQPEPAEPSETPQDYAERADLRALLDGSIAQLPVDQRAVVALAQVGLSYVESAEVLAVEIGTVKSRLSRARSRLRELLLAEAGDGPSAPPEPDAAPARSPGQPARRRRGRAGGAP